MYNVDATAQQNDPRGSKAITKIFCALTVALKDSHLQNEKHINNYLGKNKRNVHTSLRKMPNKVPS